MEPLWPGDEETIGDNASVFYMWNFLRTRGKLMEERNKPFFRNGSSNESIKVMKDASSKKL